MSRQLPIPSFNVFRALRLDQHEIRHSNFLGWLLDPNESHGQGTLFLRAFVAMAEAHTADPEGSSPPASGSRLDDAQVSRELDQLDLRIVLPSRRTVIGIENKLFTSEHSEQLARYADSVQLSFPEWRRILLYLTLDAEAPSDQRWRPLSHREVVRVISESADLARAGTLPEVQAFIRHYVELLIEVYAKREAAAMTPRVAEVLQSIAAAVQGRDGWELVNGSSSAILECGPKALFGALPPIGTNRGRDPRQWLTLRFHDHGARGYVGRYWRPSDVSDVTVRDAILRALLDREQATGFKYKGGSAGSATLGDYPAFSGDRIQDLRTGTVPRAATLQALVQQELSAVESRLPAILQAVKSAQP